MPTNSEPGHTLTRESVEVIQDTVDTVQDMQQEAGVVTDSEFLYQPIYVKITGTVDATSWSAEQVIKDTTADTWDTATGGMTFGDSTSDIAPLFSLNPCTEDLTDRVVQIAQFNDGTSGYWGFDQQNDVVAFDHVYDDNGTDVRINGGDVYVSADDTTPTTIDDATVSRESETDVWVKLVWDATSSTIDTTIQTGDMPTFFIEGEDDSTAHWLLGEITADGLYESHWRGDIHIVDGSATIIPDGSAEGDSLRWDSTAEQWEPTSLFEIGTGEEDETLGWRIWDDSKPNTRAKHLEGYHDGTDGYLQTKDADGGDLHLQYTAHDDVWLFRDSAVGDTRDLKQSGYHSDDTQARVWRQSVGEDKEKSISRYFSGLRCYFLDWDQNLASGLLALEDITDGSKNTAFGSYALRKTTIGDYNVGIGHQALYFNTEGERNLGQGYRALYNNISGAGNMAMGYQTLYSNTTGGFNTGIGREALYNNESGNANTAIAMKALYNATGSYNTGIGYQSGDNITTGTKNLMIGYDVDASAVDVDHEFRLGHGLSNTTPLLHGEMDNLRLVLGYGDSNGDYPTFEIHGKPSGDALQKFTMGHSSENPNVFVFTQDTEVERTAQVLGGNTNTYSWEVARDDGNAFLEAVADWQVRIGYGATEAGHSTTINHYGWATGADTKQLVSYKHTGDGIYSITAEDDTDYIVFALRGNTSSYALQVKDSSGVQQFEAAGDGHVYVADRLGIGTSPGYPLDVRYGADKLLSVDIDGTVRVNDEYEFPTEDGSAHELMETDGSDTLSWTSITSMLGNVDDYNSSNHQVLLNDENDVGWANCDPDTSVDTIGGTTEGSESAESSTWTAGGTKGLELYAMTRTGYYDAGNEILYGYIRKLTFSRAGTLWTVGGETRIAIDTPAAC